MTDWQAGAPVYPDRMRLTPQQQDEVKSYLWQVGITDDPFAMDPYQRKAFLSRSRGTAITVYAAIKHATRNEYQMTQTFEQWARQLGLPW